MKKHMNLRWQLVIYDAFILILVDLLLLVFSGVNLSVAGTVAQVALSYVCIFAMRFLGNVYRQIWRYGGIQCYIKLVTVDAVAFLIMLLIERSFLLEHITFARMLAISSINLLAALTMRMYYRYAFKCGNDTTVYGRFLLSLLRLFAGKEIVGERSLEATKSSIAIIGAGRVGVSLAEELLSNAMSAYTPRCFVDVSKEKAGRDIHSIPVLLEDEATLQQLKAMGVQEVVFAIPGLSDSKKKALYDHYKAAGYKIKVYDYPAMQTAGSKRYL